MATRETVAAVEENLIQYLDHFGRIPGGVLHKQPNFHAIEAGPLRRVYAARLPARAKAGIEEALSLFSPAPFPVTWMVFPSSTPADLSACLLDAGFTHAVDWTGMYLPLATAELEERKLLEFTCRRVRDRQALSAWVDIAVAGFKLPPLAGPDLIEVFDPLGLARSAPFELYLGARRGVPAVTGMLYRQGDSAGVYWIAAAPQARGQGLATALTAEMLRQARGTDATLAVLHATPVARGLYERMGFSACCTIGLYTWKPIA